MDSFELAKGYFLEGLSLLKRQDYAAAEGRFRGALALMPDRVSVLVNLSATLIRLGKFSEAKAFATKAVAIDDQESDGWINLGICLNAESNFDQALPVYDKALRANPELAEAYILRGNTLKQLKRLGEALASYDQAIKIKPDHAEAYYDRGIVLQELTLKDEALASYGQAIKLRPDYAEAYKNHGNVLHELNRLDEALISYELAIRINPDFAEAFNNRGVVLYELMRLDEALASYEQAIKIMPDYVYAWNNRGNTLKEQKRLDEALASYDQAIKLKPDYAEAHYNRGTMLKEAKRFDEALASFEQATALKSDYTEAYNNRGNTLVELRRLDEALTSYEQAIKIKPAPDFLFGTWLHTKMSLCDWSDAANQIAGLTQKIERSEKSTPPFAVLALTDSVAVQRKAAEIWVKNKYPASLALPAIPKHARHDRIRLGYYSADFHNHPIAYLAAGLFEQHDRDRFELVAFSYGPERNDEMRQRVSAAFDRFIDVRNKPDKDVALLSRDLAIDIAVDLGGFTQDMRMGIFTYRAAPLQVGYLGYPGTMGAEYIDYLIADRTIIPEESQEFYTENIVYLPHSYQVNDGKRAIADKIFSREELGLPRTGFVFCCFNNNYKITPTTFDAWMRILGQVEGSVLWLLEDNPTAARNLRKEAAERGVTAERLVFAKRMPLPEHLARHRVADLFIDTLPYNAHTTASDALWAGLPVLTIMGQAFSGRVAASLLNAIGLPELVTTTQSEYEARAVELASDPKQLTNLRQKLEKNRLSTPLFDTRLFAKNIEDGYAQMYERYQADLQPGHIYIP